MKVYPSPFNKFAVFILYGLLSVTVITLAQTPGQPEPPGQTSAGGFPSIQCPLTPFSPIPNGKIIGYVHQLDSIDTNTIQWSYYDYINVIAYPKGPNTSWNNFSPPDNPESLDPLKGFVAKASGKNTKVLLSVRNYDLSKLPNDAKTYSDITKRTLETIDDTKVDGLDIEYPGMRGIYCKRSDGQSIWNTGKDGNFVNFIEDLHDGLKDRNKTLMLTVGSDLISGLNYSHIDYLNIETYHFSFYENIRAPLAASTRTYPNAPYNKYEEAFLKWTSAGINGNKITMGIDLGNTLQIVDEPDIQNNLSVDSGKYPPLDSTSAIDLCPGNSDVLVLSTFSWNQLADSLNSSGDCYRFGGWDYHFDSATFTPWLTKNTDQIPQVSPGDPNQGNQGGQPPGEAKQFFQFISFEDRVSLNKKLGFAASKSVGGISISDISYDDGKVSLVNYIQSIRPPKPNDPGNSGGGGGGNTTDPSTAPTNTSSPVPPGPPGPPSPPPPGVIAGAVIGSIVGLGILSAILFLGYRYKDRLPFGQNKYNKETMYNYPGTHMNQPGMIPDGSPRMIIPDTTAIPVAPSYVTAMFDFAGKEENDLSFKKGDKIEVLERGDGPNDWWVGKVNGAVGEFPGNYVKE